MARPGIVYEEVEKAINELKSNGERITISRVRETLGNRGSTTTISRYLKQWKTFQEAMNASAPALVAPAVVQEEKEQTPPPRPISPEPIKSEPTPAKPELVNDMPAKPNTPPVPQAEKTAVPNYTESSRNQNDQPPGQGKSKKFKTQESRAHYNDKHQRNNQNQRHQNQNQNRNGGKNNHRRHYKDYQADEYVAIEASKPVDLETLSKDELIVKIRQLESGLIKEAARREAADKLAIDAKDYAEMIKREVSERVNDNAAVFEEMIAQLKSEAGIIQKRAEADLAYYREQLDKANQQVMVLMEKRS